MGLVIAVHALLPFMQTPIGWAIRDRPRHELVDLTVWVTRAFVMPVFFWLSGFLAHGALVRRGLADFVRQRIARVGLPLLLLVWPNSLALGALWDAGRALQPRPMVAAQLPQLRGTGLAVSLGHLWFLYYLLLVSAGAVALVLASRVAKRALAGPGRLPAFVGLASDANRADRRRCWVRWRWPCRCRRCCSPLESFSSTRRCRSRSIRSSRSRSACSSPGAGARRGARTGSPPSGGGRGSAWPSRCRCWP